ncbi:MAG: DUF1552 domain-containing protein [Gammaproteobacteria bacterium]|nr:DUF1552 domain-containing protein [Gammaproteobacteria bacterium]
MFITRKFLPRRTFLRGLGATVALPLLDAMIPAGTALAQTAAAARPRLAFVYFPHGAVMEQWTPDTTGRDFELKPILAPLSNYKDRMTIISGLGNKNADGPVHAITPGTWLSSVQPRVSHDPYGGITVDQYAAQYIGQDTPMPSLELATEEAGGGGVCDRNYGCSYGATISFRTPSTPLPMEYNPRKVFQRLFGQGDSEAERKALANQYASVLDLVTEEARELQRSLGASDRAMVDDYLDTVRELERRVQKMESRDLSNLQLPEPPQGIPNQFDEHLNLMFDLMALAFQANMTRIASLMMAAEVSNMTYNHIGVPDAFHPLSHHQNNRDKIERLAKVQVYHSQVFSKFLDKLASLPDGDGTMLDNTLLMYGSNMSNSNLHNHFPLPLTLFGGCCGSVKGGQHLRYPDQTPMGNLLLTVLLRAGVPAESFGDSNGELTEV